MRIACRAAAIGFVVVAAGVLLLWLPYCALQDLPEWIYQGYLFNELASGHAIAGMFIKNYPVPYTIVQLLISACLTVFSPIATSKAIIVIYAALSGWVAKRLIEAYDMNRALAWPVLLSIFAMNGPFWSGYIGYQFGLDLFVFYLSLGERWRTDVRVLAGLSVLAFLTHGMIYFSLAVAAAAFSFKARRLGFFVLAMIPSALMVLWYVSGNVTSKVGGEPVVLHSAAAFAAYKLYTFMKLGPYHNFMISGVDAPGRVDSLRSIVAAIVNFAFLSALVASIYAANRRSWSAAFKTPEVMTGAALIALACVLSPTALGVGNPSERILYPAFIALSSAALARKWASGGPGVSATAGMPSKVSVVAQAVLLLSLITGFTLSSAGLIVAERSYGHRQLLSGTSHSGNVGGSNAASDSSERTLFAHRMVQFDARMKETEREWRMGGEPTMPLVFDTALLGQVP